VGSGSLSGWLGHDSLELDRGQWVERLLSTAAVVGPLDSGDDRDPEMLAGGPGAAVQDVLLQQREEGLYGGVVAGSTDRLWIRPWRAVPEHVRTSGCEIDRVQPVGVDHAAGDLSAAGGSVLQGGDCEPGLHPGVDRVAHDLLGVDVLDCAQAQLRFASLVRCSVMSASHSWFGAWAVKFRRTRSAWAGRLGRPALPRLGLPKVLPQPLLEQIRHAVRVAKSPALRPPDIGSRTSSRRGGRRTARWPGRPPGARHR
jgi:hypothetical protein